MFQDVAGFVQTVNTPTQAQMVVDRAVRIAAAQRCPTVVILPADVQNLTMEEPAAEHWVSRSGVGYASTAVTPPDDELRRGRRRAQCRQQDRDDRRAGRPGATDEVVAVAERLGAGVITALLGKDVVPGDLPFHTQQLGLLGSKPS